MSDIHVYHVVRALFQVLPYIYIYIHVYRRCLLVHVYILRASYREYVMSQYCCTCSYVALTRGWQCVWRAEWRRGRDAETLCPAQCHGRRGGLQFVEHPAQEHR